MFRALFLLGALAYASASEVPLDAIVRAVCQVETGCSWRGVGSVSGVWHRGDAGEVSCWQISPAVLDDLGRLDQAGRINRDPVYAESIFRLWYIRLYEHFGNHRDALAAYHRGIRGYARADAREYAARALNLARSYE